MNRHLPVELIRFALGSRICTLSLVPVGDVGLHSACSQVRAAGEGESIEVRRLSDLVRERGVGRVDLWKLDVEGFELEALADAEELLAAKRIGAIYAGLAFGHGEQIRAYLGQFGYQCHLFDAAGGLHVPAVLPPHINGLFLPE